MRLYCQGCDASFIDLPANAFPDHCSECGGQHWATWKRGELPLSALPGNHMIPMLNANACAPAPVLTTFGWGNTIPPSAHHPVGGLSS